MHVLGYILSIPAQSHEQVINRMLPVKEFPQINADGVQAKTTAGIGVEEDCPVVKLFPEHDERVGNWCFTAFHGRIPLRSIFLWTEQRQ
jgi:hypothetical protein